MDIEGRKLINDMLDTLLSMSKHCMNRINQTGDSKCVGCALNWNYSLGNSGCLLVEILDGNCKFIDDLTSACAYNNISDYKIKLNTALDVFETECD